jgi:hypothetical protein
MPSSWMLCACHYLCAAACRGYGYCLERDRQITDVTRFQRLVCCWRGGFSSDDVLAMILSQRD